MSGPGRKVREGVVVSDSRHKTRVVAVERVFRHARYAKTIRRTSRFHVHDEDQASKRGDRVRIEETRPLSKLKHWRLVEVLVKSAEV